MTSRAAAAVLAAGLLLGNAACDPGPRKPRVVVQTQLLDRLSRAITAVNASRQRLADDAGALGAAAAALDEVDAVAVNGDRAAVRARRPAAANASTRAAAAARRMTNDVKAYTAAIDALAAAGSDGLDANQRNALDGVVRSGRTELGVLRGYAGVVATVWPRYEALNEDQKLWLSRASNGWYRTQQESAGAYVVLTDRTALDAGRRAFAAADGKRLTAARGAAAAIDAARDALASLLD